MSISTWRHGDTSYKSDMETHGDTQRHVETHGDTRRHVETHGDTQRHVETHRDTQRHVETHGDTQRHGDTPYKICSQIKTDIYDAYRALLGPMS